MRGSRLIVGSLLLLTCGVLPAAERYRRSAAAPKQTVELFAGMQQGQLAVQFIPKDSEQARLLITNKTDQPLTVQLPAAFAGVPVLAQLGLPGQQAINNPFNNPLGPRQPNRQQQQQQNNNGPQRVAGAPQPPAMFDIAPEMVGQIKVPTVCLDYGKPSPRAAIKYQLKPLGEVVDAPGLAEICQQLGRGEIAQRVAQLAAWHFSNDMSWKQLAGIRDKLVLGMPTTYTKREIDAAQKAADKALKAANKRQS
ncbi:MAG: hypothetical protein ABSG68_05365 [Thermoguttaceae bacterium]|jgi:hypothetical protein